MDWQAIQVVFDMKKSLGISLVELLVGLAVSLAILTGVGAAFIAYSNNVVDNLKSEKMNHDIQVVMDIMVNEVRRAGYWNSEAAGAPSTNPFSVVYINGNCLLYSYDADNAAGTNVSDGIQQDGERYGYKLQSAAIWMKKNGDAASATDCSQGSWERVTDPSVLSVSQLDFSLVAKCVNADTAVVVNSACTGSSGTAGQRTIEVRGVDIDFRANVIGATDAKQMNAFARLRNNSMTTY